MSIRQCIEAAQALKNLLRAIRQNPDLYTEEQEKIMHDDIEFLGKLMTVKTLEVQLLEATIEVLKCPKHLAETYQGRPEVMRTIMTKVSLPTQADDKDP